MVSLNEIRFNLHPLLINIKGYLGQNYRKLQNWLGSPQSSYSAILVRRNEAYLGQNCREFQNGLVSLVFVWYRILTNSVYKWVLPLPAQRKFQSWLVSPRPSLHIVLHQVCLKNESYFRQNEQGIQDWLVSAGSLRHFVICQFGSETEPYFWQNCRKFQSRLVSPLFSLHIFSQILFNRWVSLWTKLPQFSKLACLAHVHRARPIL